MRALSEIADNKLPYDDVYALRTGMGRVAPHLLKDGEREEANFFSEAAKLNQVSSQSDLCVVIWLDTKKNYKQMMLEIVFDGSISVLYKTGACLEIVFNSYCW